MHRDLRTKSLFPVVQCSVLWGVWCIRDAAPPPAPPSLIYLHRTETVLLCYTAPHGSGRYCSASPYLQSFRVRWGQVGSGGVLSGCVVELLLPADFSTSLFLLSCSVSTKGSHHSIPTQSDPRNSSAGRKPGESGVQNKTYSVQSQDVQNQPAEGVTGTRRDHRIWALGSNSGRRSDKS